MRRQLVAFAVLSLSFGTAPLVSPAQGGTIVVDAFTEVFPPNPCLHNTGARVMFAGPYCDGTSCPPDPWIDPLNEAEYCSGFDSQFPLPGVIGGQRSGALAVPKGSPTVSVVAESDGQGALIVSEGNNDGSSQVSVYYQGPDLSVPSLDADLSTAIRFRFQVSGDVSPESPVAIFVGLTDWHPFPTGSGQAFGRVVATGPGEWTVPTADFTISGEGFSWSSVDDIDVTVGNCPELPCAEQYPAREYRIGPILVDTSGPTSTSRTSWGRLKSIYR